MAIQGSVTVIGGFSVTGAYVRVTEATIVKQEGAWKLSYGVSVFKDQEASQAELPIRIPAPHLDRFKVDYSLLSTDNPITLAYADLKSRNLIANAEDV